MKYAFIAAAAASVLIASAATAAPFPQPQASSPVATQLTYSSVKYTIAKLSHTSFAVPVTARPIQMMVACTTLGDRGVGSVTLMRTTGSDAFLVWVGSDHESATTGTATDTGLSAIPGDHMMFADGNGVVDVQVNSANAVRIANNSTAEAMTVIVTMIY